MPSRFLQPTRGCAAPESYASDVQSHEAIEAPVQDVSNFSSNSVLLDNSHTCKEYGHSDLHELGTFGSDSQILRLAGKASPGPKSDGLTHRPHTSTGYTPLAMRRWVLVCFTTLWVLFFISLQILYSVSKDRRGIATTKSSLRYLWAYGPTVILVLITICWRQVDYTVKHIQPWAELAKGPAPAETTLLLDYITPLQIVGLWRAVKHRHATVASSILIFVLIKVLTVLSTGLMSLEPTKFSGIEHMMDARTVYNGNTAITASNVDARAAAALLGQREYGMLLPNGTTSQYAFQLFLPRGDVPGDSYIYSALVDVFSASIQCTSGKLTYNTSFDYSPTGDGTGIVENTPVSTYYNTTIQLPNCLIQHGHLDAPDWYFMQNDTRPRYGYWGMLQAVNCSNLLPSDPNFNRYVVSIAYSKGTGQNENEMLNSSNIVCTPSVDLRQGQVSTFLNGSLARDITISGKPRDLGLVTPDDLALAVQQTISYINLPARFSSTEARLDAFLQEMADITPGFELSMLMNSTWLESKAQEVFQQTAAQIAGQYLFEDAHPNIQLLGSIDRTEDRLIARSLPTRLMQALSMTIAVLTLVMIFTMSTSVVPRPIESLAGIAVILARSPSLKTILHNTGHLSMDSLRTVLSPHQFMTTMEEGGKGTKVFSIKVLPAAEITEAGVTSESIAWIRPFILRRIIMVFTLCLAVGIFVALEILYQKSQSSNGIANVDPESLARYAWLYVPTIMLVLLATIFNTLDFELEFNDPYHALARSFCDARSTMLWHPLKTISPKTAFEAFRKSRFATMASSLSVIFAPMLTISVSNLFDSQRVLQGTNVTVPTQTWFNISSDTTIQSSVIDNFFVPSLILEANMSYPQWTYDEFAFPSFDLSGEALLASNMTGGVLNLTTPALRACVKCSILPASGAYTFTYETIEGGRGSIEYNLSTPDGCGNGGWIDSDNTWFTSSFQGPQSADGLFGHLTQGMGQIRRQSDNATINCPHYYVIFGNIQNNKLSKHSMIPCTLGLETISTTVSFSLDHATIVNVMDIEEESSNRFQSYWKPDIYSAPYFSPSKYNHSNEAFDDFTNVMVYGRDGVPAENLLDDNILIAQFTHTYRQWMAQWVNAYMRDPIKSLAQNKTNIAGILPSDLSGEYINSNNYRLFLTIVSTRMLEGLIAFLFACGLVIFVFVDMRCILPKSVGTIGAVASLLAGSKLVDEQYALVPHGSEWLNDEQLKQNGLWKDEVFRMGWWVDDSWIGTGINPRPLGVQTLPLGHDMSARDNIELVGSKGIRSFRIDVRSRLKGGNKVVVR